jgi:hypothetical protein
LGELSIDTEGRRQIRSPREENEQQESRQTRGNLAHWFQFAQSAMNIATQIC